MGIVREALDTVEQLLEPFDGHRALEVPRVSRGDGIRAVGTGLGARCDDLHVEEGRQRPEDSGIGIQGRRHRPGIRDFPVQQHLDEPGVPLAVRGERRPQETLVLRSELGLDVERVDVLLDDREQRVPGECSAGELRQPCGEGLESGHRFDAEDLDGEPGRITVRESVFGEVPSVVVVHPRGDQGIKQREIGEVVEDVVVTGAGLGQRGEQFGDRP